ncbi:PREDICTED: uncharacterized protein LOC104593869 isoform X1 [Nelumbo nucifera]|uniref:Uncharacterized protein LOC104593869 isoform X1 n=2 Tax=Nelumbo nucifera TaxID=4432 RepID=A0A1U7ZGV2_NELNU|nr:PREDICTED: uncharacterized protein LOC104593869 isoform X1 [Nelumbo nucifera]
MEPRLSPTGNVSITKSYMFIMRKQSEKLPLYACFNGHAWKRCTVFCSAPKGKRGFGPQPMKEKTNKVEAPRKEMQSVSEPRKSVKKYNNITDQAPGLKNWSDRKSSNVILDREFEERLEAVRRSAIEQKKAEENKQYGAIDYDAQIESDQNTIGLGTKVGVGVAVVVFGLVFALGDFLPSGSVSPTEEASVVENKLTKEEKVKLQTRLQQFEATLSISPKDTTALEGAAVTLAELGEYNRAAFLLEDLTKQKPNDPDAYRLLGEVKFELKDFEGSASAYRSSASASKSINFEVLRGLTNALLAAKKPDEAVQVILSYREQLNAANSNSSDVQADSSFNPEIEMLKVDPIQVDLLLGKAYSDSGHISDAVSVYDQLIFSHPDDFRGYLAKGIILKENGNIGDAERMFIQLFVVIHAGTVLCARESQSTC